MWLLHLLPEHLLILVTNIILALGILGTILGYILKFVPFLIQYRIPINMLSTLLLVAGIYFKGGYNVELDWRAKVDELQQKLTAAEAVSHAETVKIETRVIEKVKYIKEKTHANKQTIQQNATVINADCRVPDIARVLYNRAINNEISRSTKGTDGNSAKVNSIETGAK
jgi:hypothetical protein